MYSPPQVSESGLSSGSSALMRLVNLYEVHPADMDNVVALHTNLALATPSSRSIHMIEPW